MYAAIQDGRFLICDESEVTCEAFARGCETIDAYRDWLEQLPTDRWGRPKIPEAPYRLIRLDPELRKVYEKLRADGYETREILYRDADAETETDAVETAGRLRGDDQARDARLQPELWREVRAKRDQLLLESDKFMIPDFPIAEAEREAWRKYRAALRDITKKAKRPDRVRWPVRP